MLAQKTKILVIDSHPFFLAGLKSELQDSPNNDFVIGLGRKRGAPIAIRAIHIRQIVLKAEGTLPGWG